MKTKILSIVFLMFTCVAVMAQTKDVSPKMTGMRNPRGAKSMENGRGALAAALNLSDEQKEAFKKGMTALQKELQPLKNELGEANAHMKTLMTADKPDLASVNKNIDKISGIKTEMAKIMVKHRLEMRALLTDEQRLKFDMMKGKMGKEGKMKGMMQQRGKRMMMGN